MSMPPARAKAKAVHKILKTKRKIRRAKRRVKIVKKVARRKLAKVEKRLST
jgi:hypothetical protein